MTELPLLLVTQTCVPSEATAAVSEVLNPYFDSPDHFDERTRRGEELGDRVVAVHHPDVRAVRCDGIGIGEPVTRSLNHLDERTRRGTELGHRVTEIVRALIDVIKDAGLVRHPDVRAVRGHADGKVELVARSFEKRDERTCRGTELGDRSCHDLPCCLLSNLCTHRQKDLELNVVRVPKCETGPV